MTGFWPLPYSADAPFTPVALADVADGAAVVITDLLGGPRRHRFGTFEWAGPEVLSTREMARIAGEVLGREVTVTVDRDPRAAAHR